MASAKFYSIMFQGVPGSQAAKKKLNLFQVLSSLRETKHVMFWNPEPGSKVGPYIIWFIENSNGASFYMRTNLPQVGYRMIVMFESDKKDAEMTAKAHMNQLIQERQDIDTIPNSVINMIKHLDKFHKDLTGVGVSKLQLKPALKTYDISASSKRKY